MNTEVITSFNDHYYNLIGKDCVSSWIKHWPTDMKLTCYVEEFTLPKNKRLIQIPFTDFDNSYTAFQESGENDRVKIFAKKAYSVIHAMENSTADRIIWIDADVVTTQKIDMGFINGLCPDDTLAAFMGVQHHRERGNPTSELLFSAETGFFVLNTRHADFKKFAARYREYYDSHIHDNLRRFYDGDVFGAIIKEMSKTKVNDMAANIKKAAKTPLKHTELGNYIHHFKSKGSKDQFNSNTIQSA